MKEFMSSLEARKRLWELIRLEVLKLTKAKSASPQQPSEQLESVSESESSGDDILVERDILRPDDDCSICFEVCDFKQSPDDLVGKSSDDVMR